MCCAAISWPRRRAPLRPDPEQPAILPAPRGLPRRVLPVPGTPADGRLLLYRICREAPPLLRPGGILLLVHSALSGEETTLRQLRAAGLEAEVTDRRWGPSGRSCGPDTSGCTCKASWKRTRTKKS